MAGYEAVDGILQQADSRAVTASEAIKELLDAQIVLRSNRSGLPLSGQGVWSVGLDRRPSQPAL